MIDANKANGDLQICSLRLVQKINMVRFYAFETLGVQAPCSCPKTTMTKEDRKAMEFFETSCAKEENRYVIGLPWKKDLNLLPNNYALAGRGLKSLERSLSKNKTKAKMYNDPIEEYIVKGWARPLSEEELNQDTKPVYYHPHHGVYRSDKRSKPIRVFFDPACKYQGVSLNSFLCKRPCLIGNLLGVIIRFREDPVVFAGTFFCIYRSFYQKRTLMFIALSGEISRLKNHLP